MRGIAIIIIAVIFTGSALGQTTRPMARPPAPAKVSGLLRGLGLGPPPWSPIDPATDAAAARMRLIVYAVREYDAKTQALPAQMQDLVSADLVPDPDVFFDPRTGKDDGFMYKKPDGATKLADLANPGQTAILYEQIDGKPDSAGLIGYADGSVRLAPAATRPGQ
jgi:hypothetical protein